MKIGKQLVMAMCFKSHNANFIYSRQINKLKRVLKPQEQLKTIFIRCQFKEVLIGQITKKNLS